ncbi:MAG: PD-(D/E)XK nuclease family protein [Candidatus Firestonebacteria bacterium]
MIKIYTCPFSWHKKKTPSEEVLSGLKAENSGKSVLYISPSGRKAEEVKSYFDAECKTWGFYSLDRFVNKILTGAGAGRYFDDKLKLILVTEILSSEEKYTSLFNKSPGTVNVLVELLTDLRNYGFGSDTPGLKKKLKTLLDTYDKVSERAVFSADILKKYQETVKKLGFADDVDRLSSAGELLGKNKTGYDILVLDGFFDVTIRQKEFFSALIKNSPETVLLHYQEEDIEEIRGIKSDFLEFAKALGKTAVIKIKREKALRNLSAQKVNKALSMEAEVSGIARRILKLKKNKSEYRDILVTFPSMFAYIPYVERIFPKYKIPFSTSVDRPYLSLPQLRPVSLLVRCILEGLPRRLTVDLVSSPRLLAFKAISREFISPFSRKAGIIGGAGQWSELAERLKNEEPDYFEKNEKNITVLEQDLKKVFFALSVLNKPLTLLNFTKELRNTLALLQYSIEEKDIKEGFYELLSGMEKMLKVLKGKENLPEENARVFLNILAKSHYQEESANSDAVRVLGVLDTRGLYSDHLFFGGLSDGDFPLKPKQEMIIPDKARKELGLVHFLRRIELQRLHFYRLVQSPGTGLYLSYSVQKGDKLVSASNFLPEADKTPPEITGTMPAAEEELQLEEGRKEGLSGFFFESEEFADKAKAGKFIRSVFSENMELSVTAIDRYLDCPFIFYLEKILGMEILEEPKFEIESAKIGALLHQVMEGSFAPGKKDPGLLEEKITFSVETELKKTALHEFWKDHIRKRVDTLLNRILREERVLFKEYPYVYCVEKKGRFKLKNVEAAVKGRIDRVDCSDKEYAVIDYKSGSGAKTYFEKTVKGESIQLALYARMIAGEGVRTPGVFCVYDLKEGKARIIKKDKVNELYESALFTAEKAVRSILNGDFPKKDTNNKGSGTCYFCSYASICKKT